MPRAMFRCDASPAIGGGHAVRSLALAQALAEFGWRVAFAGAPETVETVPAVARSGFEWCALSGDEGSEAAELAERFGGRGGTLVVDHYGRGETFERACRAFASRIVAFDDAPIRPHDCDVLLDPTPGRAAHAYAEFVPHGCRRLLGPDYALLRPAFRRARDRALAHRLAGGDVARILVGVGATDPANLTATVLRGIVECGIVCAVDVVVGNACPHLAALRDLVAELPKGSALHIDADDMAGLMEAADLAVGGAGSSSFERCCLGLPSLAVVASENQRQIAATLAAAGAAEILSTDATLTPEAVASAVLRIAGDAGARQAMSRRAASICDGRGALRVALALAPERAADGAPVALRPATRDDGAIMLDWQRDPTTRRHARNPAVPTEAEHLAWLDGTLADPARLLNVIMHGDEPAGVLRLDRHVSAPGECYEISVLVAPGKRGLGLGTAALAAAARLVPEAGLVAEVLPENRASRLLFRGAGFSFAGGKYHRHPRLQTVTA